METYQDNELERPEQICAGFWSRFGAYLIDGIILSIPLGIISIIIIVMFIGGSSELMALLNDPTIEYERELTDEEAFAFFGVFFGTIIMISIISFSATWIYFAAFHSSKWQATLGKKIVGIKVVDMNGNRIRFGRATGRFFAKAFLSGILYIGYLIATFTEKKQALHDLIAGTMVVKVEK